MVMKEYNIWNMKSWSMRSQRFQLVLLVSILLIRDELIKFCVIFEVGVIKFYLQGYFLDFKFLEKSKIFFKNVCESNLWN